MILVKWLSIAERYSKIYLDRLLAPLGLNSSQHMYITVICRNPGITQEEFTELTYLTPAILPGSKFSDPFRVYFQGNGPERQAEKLPVSNRQGI